MHPLAHPFIGLKVTFHTRLRTNPDRVECSVPHDVVGIIVACRGDDGVSIMEESGKVWTGIIGSCTFHDPQAVADACRTAREAPMLAVMQALGGAAAGES